MLWLSKDQLMCKDAGRMSVNNVRPSSSATLSRPADASVRPSEADPTVTWGSRQLTPLQLAEQQGVFRKLG